MFYSLHSFEVCRRGFLRPDRVCTVQIMVRAVYSEVRSGIANLAFGSVALRGFCVSAPGYFHAPGPAVGRPGRAVGPPVGWC